MRWFRSGVIWPFVTLAFLASRAPIPANPGTMPLATGRIIESVPCAADPAQNYALYLPSSYTSTKVWPIIYAFDPLAYGKTPVKLYKDAAEKYGYIIAASNNSRNFAADEATRAAQAVWQDTHQRLALDARRIYMMGFSGGARVATTLALRCAPCAVAGVISHGAGYPGSSPASEKDRFGYFAFVGDQDFNWPEVMELRRKKEEWSAPYHLRIFAGEHQWAPPGVFEEGIAWIQIKAMQSGSMPRDPAFIDRVFAMTQEQAEDAAQRKDVVAEFEAYRSLAADFSGLKDVSQYPEKVATLKHSGEMKEAIKQEQEAIDQQRSITQDLSAELAQVADSGFEAQPALRAAIVDGMTGLKNQAEHSKSSDKRLVLRRAFNDLWAQGIEAGQAQLESKRFSKADFYFQLIADISPSDPWPVLLRAEAQVARGDKKQAIKQLHEAVRRGLKNPDAIENDTNLQTLRSEPEFQQIVAELTAKRDAQPAR